MNCIDCNTTGKDGVFITSDIVTKSSLSQRDKVKVESTRMFGKQPSYKLMTFKCNECLLKSLLSTWGKKCSMCKGLAKDYRPLNYTMRSFDGAYHKDKLYIVRG